ncbi:MAG: hypothetical protein OIN85_03170 [Candidatus Methanoperedens sp.]|nr:hypothetical protein [Candidatus Methanoperedens sp.]
MKLRVKHTASVFKILASHENTSIVFIAGLSIKLVDCKKIQQSHIRAGFSALTVAFE